MIIRNYVYDYVGYNWVHTGSNRLLGDHYSDRKYMGKAVALINYSHVFKDLYLSTNIDVDSSIANVIIKEGLKAFYIQVHQLANHVMDVDGNIVRGSYYIGLGDKAKDLNKLII